MCQCQNREAGYLRVLVSLLVRLVLHRERPRVGRVFSSLPAGRLAQEVFRVFRATAVVEEVEIPVLFQLERAHRAVRGSAKVLKSRALRVLAAEARVVKNLRKKRVVLRLSPVVPGLAGVLKSRGIPRLRIEGRDAKTL